MKGVISRQARLEWGRAGERRAAVAGWLLFALVSLATVARGEPMSLRTLWERSVEEGDVRIPAQISGAVLAADSVGGRLALEDDSGATILEVALPEEAWKQIEVGKGIVLDFPPSRFVRRGFKIDCGSGPLIEIDGRHPPLERSGSLFLAKGKHPLELEWFNGRAASILQLALEGPGFRHEIIPGTWLWHEEGKAQGLSYERFPVKEISSLDDVPASGAGDATGVVSQIDATPVGRMEDVALRFSGQIEVPTEGNYTFRLRCDDGARLKIGGTRPAWRILPERPPVATSSWRQIAGSITYAALEGQQLRLEVATDQKRSEVTVLNPAGLDVWKLVGRRITASGVAYEGGLCVLAAEQVHFEAPWTDPARQLTWAGQVRELQPEEAGKLQRVLLQGVVTMANYRSIVLQDESGGIFVLTEDAPPTPLPELGERWIVEGITAPGDFSPIVVAERCRFQGPGALPPPRRPNWEELLNGSLDAELVEIEAIVISHEAERVELLTRDGTAVLQSNQFYPLPVELLRVPANSLVGARLKFRGVFATSWSRQLKRLSPGVFSLGNASLSVIELAPADPREVPMVTVPDLWRFTSKSTALNRVRWRGQMMARNDDTLLVSDGTYSLRIVSDSAQGTVPGDQVEVVGFARTGPISPVIVQPVVRVLAHEALPEPRMPEPSKLPDLAQDGFFIRMDGRVISDTIQSGERRLELESGELRYFAVGPSASASDATFLRDSVVRVDGVYFAATSAPLAMGPGDFEIRTAGDQALQLVSRPSWWSTRRLLLLVAVLLGGLSLVLAWAAILQRLVRRRTSQLTMEIAKKEHAESERALEIERARVARDLHDELGAGLTEIGLLGSLIGNPAIPATTKSNYLGTLGDVSRSLVSALDEIVWAINPDYDSVDDLAGYLWLHAQRLLKPAGIRCDPVKPVDIPSRSLGSRSRHSLLLAFKEALNNVIKHSGADRVDLGVRVEKDNLVVSIADNGSGILAADPPQPGSQGITGMHERMHDLGGECDIATRPDGGTVVSLTLPLRSS
ncbi:PA14 domain-containing protein [Luteolibacter arcticus]|uniref:PA14 domain-containing protein n=1 Tax=Luteolibacter arcticus TaxID=1581411 RepID=A0ABT3GDZ1_9BACT|nr:ATP-binding protein [Luteolibacter arcticus]MCW1921784.1 PA14 domain-containing protein [Luteolibacter arcticus]